MAFDVADYYRNPVMILADGMIGQMMEAIEWHEIPKRELPPKDLGHHRHARASGSPTSINSLYIDPNRLRRPQRAPGRRSTGPWKRMRPAGRK